MPPEALARFLPEWHGIGSRATGSDRLLEVVFQLQGLALPASVIERDVIAGRVANYNPRLLDELVSMGDVVWVGRGSLGTNDGRVALYLAESLGTLLPPESETELSERAQKIMEAEDLWDVWSFCRMLIVSVRNSQYRGEFEQFLASPEFAHCWKISDHEDGDGRVIVPKESLSEVLSQRPVCFPHFLHLSFFQNELHATVLSLDYRVT